MTTLVSPALSRQLLAAGLALASTIASFALTVAPVHAQAPVQRGYAATLSTALVSPANKVLGDVVWDCAGTTCSGPADAPAASACAQVAKSFGHVAEFMTPKGAFNAAALKRCNGE